MFSDDEAEDTSPWKGVPATVILINGFDKKHDTVSTCHTATCEVIKRYLRLSSPDNVAVSIYGIKNNSPSLSLKNVVDIIPLSPPTLEDFKKLENININSYTSANDLILSEVLWHASKKFTNCKKQLSRKSIVILSRLDTSPVMTDQRPTLKRVVDLTSLGIDINLINVANSNYDIHPFYEDFFKATGRDVAMPVPLWNSTDIAKKVYQQSNRHLTLAKLSFDIGEGLSIGVGVYSIVRKVGQGTLRKCLVDKETNEVITSVNKIMKETTDVDDVMDIDEDNEPKLMPLLSSELQYYDEYGGEKITLSVEEKKQLDNPFGAAAMKLLGFKPSKTLCMEKWFFKRGYFLFPNESIVEGSTVAFKALHKACQDTSMVAICVLRTRRNTRTMTVALSPTKNPLGLDVEIGFDVIFIPFVENVRNLPSIEDDVETTENQKNVMRQILTSVTFDYTSDKFENPKLQTEYEVVESFALDKEMAPSKDTTKPNFKMFEGIDEDLFEETFGPFGVSAVKRPAAQPSASKKAKLDDLSDEFVKTYIENKRIDQLNKDQIMKILKTRSTGKLPALTGLKKQELVALVYKSCS